MSQTQIQTLLLEMHIDRPEAEAYLSSSTRDNPVDPDVLASMPRAELTRVATADLLEDAFQYLQYNSEGIEYHGLTLPLLVADPSHSATDLLVLRIGISDWDELIGHLAEHENQPNLTRTTLMNAGPDKLPWIAVAILFDDLFDNAADRGLSYYSVGEDRGSAEESALRWDRKSAARKAQRRVTKLQEELQAAFDERDARVREAVEVGNSLRTLGRGMDLSFQRVAQIVEAAS